MKKTKNIERRNKKHNRNNIIITMDHRHQMHHMGMHAKNKRLHMNALVLRVRLHDKCNFLQMKGNNSPALNALMEARQPTEQ